ncbi:MAG: branched-chain amino acid ABC transporter permease [Rhodoferax sp.]|nr:branched-chain amino acid ABC transporter permease [Rhodoferax sp.]
MSEGSSSSVTALDPTARAQSRRLVATGAFAVLLGLLPLVLPNAYFTDVAIRISINAVIAIALNLLVGYAGQISLGHAAFYGVGAYASGVLTSRFGLPSGLALLASVMVTAALSWLVASAILRLRGHYLAMATLGLGIVVSIVISNESAWTGGPDGMSVGNFSVFGWNLTGEKQWYWLFTGLLLAMIVLAQNLIDSPAGRALQALHGSEIAACVVGIDTVKFKTRVFVFSAVVAAVIGSLSAHYLGFITPGLASLPYSIELVTMVVIGGMASVWGSVFGAALLTLLPQALTRFEGWETIVFGLILIVTMIFLPRGVVPSLAKLLDRKDN